ncbi:MAG: hypothetical protein ACRCTQ_01650 [Brevinemataceae bacterium]
MKNIKNQILITILVLLGTACSIEEIPRQPLLASPLGLTVSTAASTAPGGGTGIAMFFTSMNNEIFFSGYAIYISTRKEDFQSSQNIFFAVKPTDVPGSDARLLVNYQKVDDEFLTLSIVGAMAYPNMFYYPPDAVPDSTQIPNFTSTSFSEIPNKPDGTGAGPFVPGTIYYFAVYAYSAVDNIYSLPSNIAELKFELKP